MSEHAHDAGAGGTGGTGGTAGDSLPSIVYYTDYDVSLPNGPNVNEFEFSQAFARRYGDRAVMVLAERAEPVRWPGPPTVYDVTRPVPALRPVALVRYLLCAIRTALLLRRVCARHRPELVVIRFEFLPIAAWLFACFGRQPYALKTVMHYWGVDPPRTWRAWLVHVINRGLGNAIVRRAVAVDVVSAVLEEGVRRQSRRVGPIAVVPNATDVNRFRPAEGPRVFGALDLRDAWPVLGYVGGSPSERGARQLIDIAEQLLPSYPRLHAVVVGWDDGMTALQQLAAERGVADHYHCLGVIAYRRVPEAIHLFDVGFSLDRPERSAVEGHAEQKVRQYLACGRPVVCMPTSNAFVLQHDLGRFGNPADHGQLVGATREVLGWLESDAAGLRARIRAYAERYLSMEETTDTRIALWREALGGTPRPGEDWR